MTEAENLKSIEFKEKELQHKSKTDEEKVLIEKITSLGQLISEIVPMEPVGYSPSETIYVPALSAHARDVIEAQILKLVKKIC